MAAPRCDPKGKQADFAARDIREALLCYFQRTIVRWRASSELFPRSAPPKHRSPVQHRNAAQTILCFRTCIKTPDITFAIAHGLSNNSFKRMDIDSTRETFGYDPKDNAFELLGFDEPEQNRK